MMVHAAGLHRLISEPSIISRSIIQHHPIRLCGEIEKARVMKNKWLSQTSKLIGPLFIFLLCLLDFLSLPAIHFYGNFHRSVANVWLCGKIKTKQHLNIQLLSLIITSVYSPFLSGISDAYLRCSFSVLFLLSISPPLLQPLSTLSVFQPNSWGFHNPLATAFAFSKNAYLPPPPPIYLFSL